MPKRKSPEGAEGKDASKVTKQEKPAPPKCDAKTDAKPDVKPKKVLSKPVVDDKGMKGKKVVAKGKREDGPAQNGETKGEICVSRSCVSVSSSRSFSPSLMSVRGQSKTVRVKGN